MRLKDADALIEKMRGCFIDGIEENIAVQIINSAPTIEPKRGEWRVRAIKAYKGDILMGGYCSVCGYENHHFDYNFCPSCGAMMEGADDE